FLQLDHFEQQKWMSRAFPKIAINNADVTALFADRDNSLWVGTANHGMFRISANAADNYGHTDGLSSDAVVGFFQDTEGTVWIVTSGGIYNFRDTKGLSYSMREGLAAAGAGTVVASRNGNLWVGNYHALDLLKDGKLSALRSDHGLPGLYIT